MYTKKEICDRISKIDYFALDMDGTIYLGDHIFPFTKSFLDDLKRNGKEFIFLTNNSSKSVQDYQQKLLKMGIEADIKHIYTSGIATIEFLNQDTKKNS